MQNILDEKDRRLLLELDTDARQSLRSIAAKLRTTKEAVSYRMRQLEEKGIITNYIALAHFAKLGLTHYKLYIKFRNVKEEKKQSIIRELMRQESIGWLATTEGTFDLMIAIRFPTLFEFERFKDELFTKYDNTFQKNSFAVLTEAETYPRQYILGKANPMRKAFTFCNPAEKIDIDKEDIDIIKAMSKNSRLPSTAIAKMTGLSERVVRYRRNALEKKGIIVGTKLAINYRKLGYLFFKCLIKFQNMTPEKMKSFRMYCRQHPNVVHFLKVLGEWDIELEIEAPSIQEFYSISNEIRHKFSDIIQVFDPVLVSQEHMISHA